MGGGRPWSEWKRGKPLSPRGLSDLLKPFKVKPQDVRLGGRVLKGYKRDPLERVPRRRWRRCALSATSGDSSFFSLLKLLMWTFRESGVRVF